MAKGKAKIVFPDGSVYVRRTDRVYTHAVVEKRDETADEADSLRRRIANTEHDIKSLEPSVKARAPVGDWAWMLQYHPADESLAKIDADYAAAVERLPLLHKKLAELPAEHVVSPWYVVGFCGRLDLAHKLAAKDRSYVHVVDSAIVPVEKGE